MRNETKDAALTYALLIGTLIFCAVMVCGCASSGMRNGVAQARHEIQAGMALENPKPRMERADTILQTWQESYGGADRPISDDSFFPVKEQMETERTFISTIKGLAGKALGQSWVTMLFGAGGMGTVLLGVVLKMLQEKKKRKGAERDALDCAGAIEAIKDEAARKEAKETVRKKQAGRTALGQAIKNKGIS